MRSCSACAIPSRPDGTRLQAALRGGLFALWACGPGNRGPVADNGRGPFREPPAARDRRRRPAGTTGEGRPGRCVRACACPGGTGGTARRLLRAPPAMRRAFLRSSAVRRPVFRTPRPGGGRPWLGAAPPARKADARVVAGYARVRGHPACTARPPRKDAAGALTTRMPRMRGTAVPAAVRLYGRCGLFLDETSQTAYESQFCMRRPGLRALLPCPVAARPPV